MQQPIFYTAGCSDALRHAQNRLVQWGYSFSPVPTAHVTHLLLPVPSFDAPGILKGGQNLADVLRHLPETLTILGGALPKLPYRCADFLQDEFYLNENAQITAQCAMQIMQQERSLPGAQVLLIGWGRIAKRLLPLLQAQECLVSVAARREDVLASLRLSAIPAVPIGQWQPDRYDILINTAPALLLDQSEAGSNSFLLDLASVQGISGQRVLWARGLPNRIAPEASGTLIAKTALRYALGKESI